MVMLICVVLFMPDGVLGGLRSVRALLRWRRR